MTGMEAGVPQAQLRQLLREALGGRVEIVDCQMANQQHDYQVLLLRLRRPARRVVVKLAGPEAGLDGDAREHRSFERSAMLHRLVTAQTTIPMPEVLAVDSSMQRWPWRYILRTHLPGLEWAAVRPQLSPDELDAAYGEIGSAVAQLHAIRFPAFGDLAEDGGVIASGKSLPGVQGSLAVSLGLLPALKQHARRIIRSHRLRDTFLYLLDREHRRFRQAGQPVLCHEDLHQHNLLFQRDRGKWRLATILDFDKAWAGPAESDLARLEFWKGMTHPAFWQAYRAVSPPDDHYSQRRPIYQLLWCFEFARSTPEHLADTRGLCAQLGLPPVDAFDDPPPA
jgi:fructosamine-3-kinase